MQKKKSKTLYFIRHGETDFNTDPIPRVRGRVPIGLNEAGLRHAKQAGEFLKDTKISSIYYSAVNRAEQTAQAVYEYHKDAKFVEEPLVLDISWGDWEGKTYEEAFGDPKGGDYVKNPSRLLVPNGESFYSVVDRFRKFLFRILDSDEDGTISAININRKALGNTLDNIISPIITQIIQQKAIIEENDFIQAMDVLFSAMNMNDRGKVLNVKKKIKKKKNDVKIVSGIHKERLLKSASTGMIHPMKRI